MNSPEYPFSPQPVDPFAPDQGLTLRDYLQILNKRRMTVLTVFCIVFTVSVILGMKKDAPLYTSVSTILMERNLINSNAGLGMFYVWDPEFLPTQTEIIKSKKVAQRVVDQLELGTKYYNHFFPKQNQDDSWLTNLIKLPGKIFTSVFHHAPNDGQNTGDPKPASEQRTRDIIADMVRTSIELEPVKETRVVNIKYTDANPTVAKMVNDALVKAYIDETLDIKLNSTQQSLRWMTSKADQERKKLEEAEGNLQKYMREHNLVTLEDRLAVYPEKLTQFSTELSTAESKRKELDAIHAQIARFGITDQSLEAIPIFSQNATLQSLRDQILKADQRIKELSKKYGAKHPLMIKAMDDREVLSKEKASEIKRITESIAQDYELAKSREENLRDLLNTTKEELLDVNERFIQYSIMKREVESSRALYEALTSTIKKASVTEETQNVNIWVMREASLPDSPSNQRPRRTVLIGFILALAAAVGLALLVEYFDNTIKTSDDIEKRYQLTVLGAIFETRKNEAIEQVIEENSQSPAAESYRMIRSSLLLSSADHPPRTILITSMTAQEGKTSTALNLARTMAQMANKVLIIDADMRKPRIHSLLNLPNNTGLSTYLSGNTDEKIVHRVPDKNIYIIPSGPIPPNPVELISSHRMIILLEDMGREYDFIFIDSPPIIHLADGLILSTLVDGTVLVARAGRVTTDIFTAGLKKLNDFKPHILGVVLNGMNARLTGSHSYYYYHYKSHYREEGQHPEQR
ncbi:MAG TPA: hypothetical protein DDY20_03685 [Desulfobulbaceae bacterium]|nr:hypothetical protein [Desulfobulbaceae bacterium]